jgi:hypothetical protein
MHPLEASLLAVFYALSAAACTKSETDSRTRSRAEEQTTIVLNASRGSVPAAAAPTREQSPDNQAGREQPQTIVIEPRAALEPAKVEFVATPIEFAPPKAPIAPQARTTAAVPLAQPSAIGPSADNAFRAAPSADNANLSAVVNELSDLLRDLTAPGGKANPDSPLMKSIRSGNPPQPTPPPSEGR